MLSIPLTDRPSTMANNSSLCNTTAPPPTAYDDDDFLKFRQLIEDSPLKDFSAHYQRVHGYISIVVCSFGIVSNLMNAVVLSRKTMLSATNYLLTALAVVDLCTMTLYLPYATYFFCVTSPDNSYPHAQGWIVYLLITTNLFITFHTIAMWLTVSLAVFRYVVVCRRAVVTQSVGLRCARITTVVVPAVTVLFCVPNYVMFRPVHHGDLSGWWFGKNAFVTPVLDSFNLWLFGVVLKVAPCVLLTVLSALLILAMRAADRRRRRLLSQGKREESERTGEHNRTTAMLVAVVLIFVLGELPPGILALLSGVDPDIFYSYYVPLGDVWDIVALVNSATNFILYCIMSAQFRAAFRTVFCSKGCGVWGALIARWGGRGQHPEFDRLEPVHVTRL